MSDTSPPPRRGHLVALVRTVAYSAVSTLVFAVAGLAASPLLLVGGRPLRAVMTLWVRVDLALLRVLAGQRLVVLGRENVPTGAALVASKHQAAWETVALLGPLPKGVIILKQELMRIPVYGHYARGLGMIPVDRAAGPSALKKLAADAAAALRDGVQIVIFPEGTRRPVGAPPDYKPGAVFLYERLGVPMVPVALNSGVLWPRGRFVRYPGTVTMAFLPAIPPGLPRAEAKAALERAIETETARLVALDGRPPPEAAQAS